MMTSRLSEAIDDRVSDLASGRRTRRSQAERREASMTQILDSAEAAFAELGYGGVNLNEVAKRSGIPAQLMRYYFGDKAGLFSEVIERRATVINAIRMKVFDTYEAEMGDAMTLEGVINAFVQTGFEMMSRDAGWKNYCTIIAHINNSPQLRQFMSEAFNVISLRMIALMRRVLPHAQEKDIYWSFQFLTGAYTYSLADTRRIDELSKGLVSSGDSQELSARFARGMAAAVEAVCGPAKGTSSR
jgi:AcrR family transcriptional regulator